MPDTPSEPRDDDEFEVSELLSPTAGSSSPFGEIEFPLPIAATGYVHPGRRERPNLAGE